MSYATVNQISQYLLSNAPVYQRIRDQKVILRTGQYVDFFEGPVDDSSFIAKSLRPGTLQRIRVTLTSAASNIGTSSLVPGSLVVASDSSLGVVYQENRDFVVDYDTGTVTIKDGGTLSPGMSVTVWFLPYTVYQNGTDLMLDAARGRIRAMASGDVADGETVLLDYTPNFGGFTDDLINTAVLTANRLVAAEVDPDGQFGADPTLATAAAYRALEIVCRILAGRVLTANRTGERTAPVWLKLAGDYGSRADHLLKSFRPPVIRPSSPRHT
jgi:hypothetical protein